MITSDYSHWTGKLEFAFIQLLDAILDGKLHPESAQFYTELALKATSHITEALIAQNGTDSVLAKKWQQYKELTK